MTYYIRHVKIKNEQKYSTLQKSGLNKPLKLKEKGRNKMKKFISAVAVISIMMFMIGCTTKGAGITVPLQATSVSTVPVGTQVVTVTSTATVTATATETSTTVPGTPTVTETSTTALTPFPTVIPSGTPVCSISISTGISIPVVIISGTYVGTWPNLVFVPSGIGTLFISNNGLIPIPYKAGDILRVLAQDQSSMVTITITSSWGGGGTEAKTVPNGNQNWIDILP